tara:strand:+ start:2663 stop:3082 length:420 start_codon:yes stop_codon:yes gene_type:complete
MNKKHHHDLEIGDILSASWGYDQTNINYFEVVKTSPKSVEVLEVEGVSLPEHDQTASVATMGARGIPVEAWRSATSDYPKKEDGSWDFRAKKILKPKRCKSIGEFKGEGYNSLRIKDHMYARYDKPGTINYETHWAYGH